MPLAGIFKTQHEEKAQIDSYFFKLHYRVTTTLLFLSCILVNANSLIGKPIECVSGTDGQVKAVLNTYCWISQTFSVPPRSVLGLPEETKDIAGEEFAYPGVQPYTKDGSKDKVFHAYYQWVAIVLFLQAIFFYIPHQLWKGLEGGKISTITNGLLGRTMKIEERKQKRTELVGYLHETWNMHNTYAAKYFFCLLLNIVNVIVQVYLIDLFLGGAFMKYGLDYLQWVQSDYEDRFEWEDPMIKVFPRITKCTFHKYGSSGTIEAHDSLCVLAVNIINEKIYIALWVWFVILGILTLLDLIYIVGLYLIPSSRVSLVERKMKSLKDSMNLIKRKGNIGDWFMINQLSKNMDEILFTDFLEKLAEKLKTDPPNLAV